MCSFKPFNKYILVEKEVEPPKETNSGVLLPDNVQAAQKDRYGLVRFVCAASDCEQSLRNLNKDTPTWATQNGTNDDKFFTSARESAAVSLIVDSSMIEEINFSNKKINVVHQNYVVGIVGE